MFVGIFVSVGSDVVYFNQNNEFPEGIEAKSSENNNELNTAHKFNANAFKINTILQNNKNNDIEQSDVIELSFGDKNQKYDWKLHYENRMDLIIAIIVKYSSDDERIDDIKQKISIIFDTMYTEIQKYFIQSIELPLYILQLRCHLLTEKLLIFANNTSINCCLKHELTNLSDKNMLESYFETRHRKQIEYKAATQQNKVDDDKELEFTNIIKKQKDVQLISSISGANNPKTIQRKQNYVTVHFDERVVVHTVPHCDPSRAQTFSEEAIDESGSAISISLPSFQRSIPVSDQQEQIPKLIDNIFGDLENMFYLLSDLIYFVMIRSMNGFTDIICNLIRIILWFIVYPLIFVIVIIIVLPSCLFLLIVRMSKIESDTINMAIREYIIKHESCCQRMLRLINQFFRSFFMFGILTIYPLIVIYHIIPKYGQSDKVILSSIGSYLILILLLQIFGTYRGLKSFTEKHKYTKINGRNSEFKPQKFLLNIGSLWAILMILYEVNQMALFAFHTINNNEEGKEKETSEPSLKIENENWINFNNKLRDGLASISYLTINNLNKIPILEYYFIFGLVCVSILILFFIIRFIYELRIYVKYKYIQENEKKAREYYFHSFCGTIIYGHGRLENVNKWSAKIVSLISDVAFLGICEKLILILVCNPSDNEDKNVSTLSLDDGKTICWNGKHQIYAALSLILIGYYIPLSTMIAPMFDEIPGQNQQNEVKKFLSMENCVDFVKPFISAVTVTKCFMLIFATFIFKGDAIGTIICDGFACLILMIFTLKWIFTNLNLYGLTQNEPGFPFAISLMRSLGFFAAICGAFIETLKISNIIDQTLDFILLYVIVFICGIGLFFVFWKYHSKFNSFDDYTDTNLLLQYDYDTKKIQFTQINQNT